MWSMRRLILRRSVSSWVSPGPRVPMPPPSCDMARPQGEAGQLVFELCEFYLKLAFAGLGVAGEDVEDELRTVDDVAG